MVRFKAPYFIKVVDGVYGTHGWNKKLLGLLVEYESWEKMATVMYEGELLRVAARDVEKTGKRDYESR